MKEELRKAYEELVTTTRAKEEYEIEYSLEEARMVHSAEVNAYGNQTMRDAQVRILMENNGMYRKVVNLRTDAKIAYYKWSTFKTLLEGRE